MKKVLVLGATGAMGRYLVPMLAEAGHSVTAVALGKAPDSFAAPGIRCVDANAKDRKTVEGLLAEKPDAIVDFLVYATGELASRLPMLVASTGQYVYLSTYRVYDGKDVPVREDSRLLLDTADDPLIRWSDDYSVFKARGEYTLRGTGRRNWTIVRPSITYSTGRNQLVTLEAPHVVGRADTGRAVVVPESARNVQGTMTWAGDNARFIARLVFNDKALGEAFTLATAEHRTWGEIAEIYARLRGLKAVWAPEEDFLKILSDDPWNFGPARQLRTDRLFDRVIDNTKVLAATGLSQSDLMPLEKGLELELSRIPRDFDWSASAHDGINTRMDAWLAGR